MSRSVGANGRERRFGRRIANPQSLMSRATRPEAVRAGKEVLLVDGLQHHDNRPLRHLVFESWKAEGPTRSIRLRDIYPPDRRCVVAARLDALQEIQKIGLQV
jgi:hypothetical protein